MIVSVRRMSLSEQRKFRVKGRANCIEKALAEVCVLSLGLKLIMHSEILQNSYRGAGLNYLPFVENLWAVLETQFKILDWAE